MYKSFKFDLNKKKKIRCGYFPYLLKFRDPNYPKKKKNKQKDIENSFLIWLLLLFN